MGRNARDDGTRGESPWSPGDPLSAKETETLRLLAQGYTYDGIARIRKVSNQTVKNQMQAVYIKLGAHTRAHAVAIAKDRGLI